MRVWEPTSLLFVVGGPNIGRGAFAKWLLLLLLLAIRLIKEADRSILIDQFYKPVNLLLTRFKTGQLIVDQFSTGGN